MTGGFGYEMDLGKLSLEEKEEVKRQIEAYKQYAELIMHGDYFRLVNPDEGRDICAWEFVSKDKKKGIGSLCPDAGEGEWAPAYPSAAGAFSG